jgi:hypothetical protein
LGYYLDSDAWPMFDSYHWNDAGIAAWYSDFKSIVTAMGYGETYLRSMLERCNEYSLPTTPKALFHEFASTGLATADTSLAIGNLFTLSGSAAVYQKRTITGGGGGGGGTLVPATLLPNVGDTVNITAGDYELASIDCRLIGDTGFLKIPSGSNGMVACTITDSGSYSGSFVCFGLSTSAGPETYATMAYGILPRYSATYYSYGAWGGASSQATTAGDEIALRVTDNGNGTMTIEPLIKIAGTWTLMTGFTTLTVTTADLFWKVNNVLVNGFISQPQSYGTV